MLSQDYRGKLAADSPYRTDVLTAQDIVREVADGGGYDDTPVVTTNVDGLNPSPYGNVPVIAPLAATSQGRVQSRGYPFGVIPLDAENRHDSATTPPKFGLDNGIAVMSAIAVQPADIIEHPAHRSGATAVLPGAAGSDTQNTARAQLFQLTDWQGFAFWAALLLLFAYLFWGKR